MGIRHCSGVTAIQRCGDTVPSAPHSSGRRHSNAVHSTRRASPYQLPTERRPLPRGSDRRPEALESSRLKEALEKGKKGKRDGKRGRRSLSGCYLALGPILPNANRLTAIGYMPASPKTDFAAIRRHLAQERALGDDRFQRIIETTLNRPAACRPRTTEEDGDELMTSAPFYS